MKKIALVLCSLAAVSTSSQAQWETNWLLGVSGSYNWNDNDDFEGTISHAGTNRVTGFSRTANGDDNDNWSWGLLGGYQARCNGWVIGAEASIDWVDNTHRDTFNFAFTDANTPNRGWTGDYNYHRDYAVALTGRLGYAVSPFFIPFIRAGAETSRDKIGFSLFTPAGAPFLIASNDGRRQSYRIVAGLGAEVPVPLFDGVTFRGEWNYHTKGKTVDAAALANDNATYILVSDQQSINTAKASLVYNFPF